MPSRFQKLRKNYKELIDTDPNFRNRMLVVVVLLLLLIVLVMFSMRQGFSVLEQTGSQLMVFIAINVNIVLLAIVFYMIARNLLKLSYERRQARSGRQSQNKTHHFLYRTFFTGNGLSPLCKFLHCHKS